jgi:hypothetical protein
VSSRLRWSLHVLIGLVSLSGLALFWTKYLVASDDPFAVVNHPLEPFALALHVLTAPALILAFGMALESHIARKLAARQARANRRTGLTALSTFLVMSASGYLLQVVTRPWLLTSLVVIHVASGTVFAATYCVHLLISARRFNAKPDENERSALVA